MKPGADGVGLAAATVGEQRSGRQRTKSRPTSAMLAVAAAKVGDATRPKLRLFASGWSQRPVLRVEAGRGSLLVGGERPVLVAEEERQWGSW